MNYLIIMLLAFVSISSFAKTNPEVTVEKFKRRDYCFDKENGFGARLEYDGSGSYYKGGLKMHLYWPATGKSAVYKYIDYDLFQLLSGDVDYPYIVMGLHNRATGHFTMAFSTRGDTAYDTDLNYWRKFTNLSMKILNKISNRALVECSFYDKKSLVIDL